MLSDICSDFLSQTEGMSDDEVRANIAYITNGVEHYRNGSVFDYDPRVLKMLDDTVRDFTAGSIEQDKLRLVLTKVMNFYDNPNCPSYEQLFKDCNYTPS